MAEANQVYHERVAVAALSRLAAKKPLKRQLQAQAIKLSSLTGREIAILANDYLLTHRAELCEAATAQYRRWVKSDACARQKH